MLPPIYTLGTRRGVVEWPRWTSTSISAGGLVQRLVRYEASRAGVAAAPRLCVRPMNSPEDALEVAVRGHVVARRVPEELFAELVERRVGEVEQRRQAGRPPGRKASRRSDH